MKLYDFEKQKVVTRIRKLAERDSNGEYYLEDRALSLEAQGLLTLMHEHSDELFGEDLEHQPTELEVARMVQRNSREDSFVAVRVLLEELEICGYIKRRKQKKSERTPQVTIGKYKFNFSTGVDNSVDN